MRIWMCWDLANAITHPCQLTKKPPPILGNKLSEPRKAVTEPSECKECVVNNTCLCWTRKSVRRACVLSCTHVTHTAAGTVRPGSVFSVRPQLTAYPITAAETLVTKESTLKLPGVIQCGPRDMCKIDSVISDWAPSRDYLPQDAAVSEPWAACQTRKVNVVQRCSLYRNLQRKPLNKERIEPYESCYVRDCKLQSSMHSFNWEWYAEGRLSIQVVWEKLKVSRSMDLWVKQKKINVCQFTNEQSNVTMYLLKSLQCFWNVHKHTTLIQFKLKPMFISQREHLKLTIH